MRNAETRIVPIAFTLLLSGCATLGTPANDAFDTPPPEESALSATYRQLEQTPVGGSSMAAFPDGFGGNGVTVTRRYLSASGKRCTVVAEAASGKRRTLCRNDNGITNAFSSPDDIRPY